MKTKQLLVESHLTIHQKNLGKGEEWMPRLKGWCFAVIKSGSGYWQSPKHILELATGSMMCISPKGRGILRASQLHDLVIKYFWVDPNKLSGLFSLAEQQALNRAAANEAVGVRLYGPEQALAINLQTLCIRPGALPLAMRLKLLQFALEAMGADLEPKKLLDTSAADSRMRLRQLLNEMAAADLAEISLLELAPKVYCSPRHLRRLFREEVGTSFREKQSELRLAKACELLVNTDAKVVDVGLSSGYHSNSLFSLAIKKRFGVSPGEWRQQNASKLANRARAVRLNPL
jgi:AraC-like DNA-binding protein